MIIRFQTVRTNELEMYEKGIEVQKAKEAQLTMGIEGESPEFHNEEDWIATTTLDMSTVVDWSEGKVWQNHNLLSCVYARLQGGFMTSAILITVEDFEKLYEKIHNIKIYSDLEYLAK